MNQDSSNNHDFRKFLREIRSDRPEYPADLLSARRAAFLDQVAQYNAAEIQNEFSEEDRKVIDLLLRLRSYTVEYPGQQLASRRASFVRRIIWLNLASYWTALRTTIQSRIGTWTGARPFSWRTSLIAASFTLAVFLGVLFFETRPEPQLLSDLPEAEVGAVRSGRIMTSDTRETRIVCKPGYLPPLCLAGEYEHGQALAFHGNGIARPAVAKDTMPGYGTIHRPSNVNDGLYGPGTSWVSRSKNSWIKIDLGEVKRINTIAFGRDRLGKYIDRNPGQFVIALALYDDTYANGNDVNDDEEYVEVYNSKEAGFTGTIDRAETITADFEPRFARYIKITFENEGTAIDEIEARYVQRPVIYSVTEQKREDDWPGNTSTPLPTNTDLPTITPYPTITRTVIPTFTSQPTETRTPVPTDTATSTPTPLPTSTPVPSETATAVPTNTPVPPTTTPVPTETGVSQPGDPIP